jgi:hypothetical protein
MTVLMAWFTLELALFAHQRRAKYIQRVQLLTPSEVSFVADSAK